MMGLNLFSCGRRIGMMLALSTFCACSFAMSKCELPNYTASYQLSVKSKPAGTIDVQYSQSQGHYSIVTTSHLHYWFFKATVVATTKGVIKDGHFQPVSYTVDNQKSGKISTVRFDRDHNQVLFKPTQNAQPTAIAVKAGALDPLSYKLQFRHDVCHQAQAPTYQYFEIDKDHHLKLMNITLSAPIKDTVALVKGQAPVATLKLVQTSQENPLQVQYWLLPSMNYMIAQNQVLNKDQSIITKMVLTAVNGKKL